VATAEQQLTIFLAKYTPEMQKTAKAARRKMRALFPKAVELVYDNYNALVIGYGPTERASDALCSIAVYPKWVTLFFLRGTEMQDPDGLLKGGGKIVRQIRLDDASDLDKPAVKKLIRQAIGLADVPFARRRLVIRSVSAKQRPRRPAAK
jgi:hypothetical protein